MITKFKIFESISVYDTKGDIKLVFLLRDDGTFIKREGIASREYNGGNYIWEIRRSVGGVRNFVPIAGGIGKDGEFYYKERNNRNSILNNHNIVMKIYSSPSMLTSVQKPFYIYNRPEVQKFIFEEMPWNIHVLKGAIILPEYQKIYQELQNTKDLGLL